MKYIALHKYVMLLVIQTYQLAGSAKMGNSLQCMPGIIQDYK